MADEVLKLIVSADVTQGITAFKQLEKSAQSAADAAKKASSETRTAASSLGPMPNLFGDQIKAMNMDLTGLRSQLGGVAAESTTAAESTGLLSTAMAGLGGPLAIVGAAIAAQAIALGALASAALQAGIQYDDALRSIAGRTGETGAALEGLGKDFLSVFSAVPQSASEVAGVISLLHQRFDLTGESLQNLAVDILNFSRVTGTPVQSALKGMVDIMSSWNLTAADAPGLLDRLTVAFQKSGIPIATLTGVLENSDAILKQYGFDVNTSISFLAQLERTGANVQKVMSGLQIAAPKFAAAGISPEAGLQSAIEAIQNAPPNQGLELAKRLFGRSGVELFDDIKSGSFALDEMNKMLDESAGALQRAAAASLTLGQEFEILKHNAEALLTPIGTTLVGIIRDSMIPAFVALGVPIWQNIILLEQLFSLIGLTPAAKLSPTDINKATRVGPGGAAPALSAGEIAQLSGKGAAPRTQPHYSFEELMKVGKKGEAAADQIMTPAAFDLAYRKSQAALKAAPDYKFELSKQAKEMTASFEAEEKARNEILKQNGEIRIASAATEAERVMAQHELDRQSFLESELFKTATVEQQGQLRANFEELFQAQQDAKRRDRITALQDEIALDAAGISGGQGPNAKFRGQLAELAVRQSQELRKASTSGATAEEITLIQQKQGLEVIKLQQNQYDEMFSKVKTQAEGVFDAIFLRGKKGFAGLLDYIKGVFVTGLKDLFGDLVATLFTGRRPGGGSAATGGLFGGLSQLITGGAGGGGGGLFGGLGGLFGGGLGGIFGGGGGGQGGPGGVFGGGVGPGGIFSLTGGGGGGAAGLAGIAPLITSDAFGNVGLGTGGAGGPINTAGLIQPGTGYGVTGLGKSLSHFFTGTTAGALTAGIGGGFAGGFGIGKLLGISGARSGIAGGIGAGAGLLATAFLGPIAGALIGAGIGALTAGLFRIFGGKPREKKFQEEILRDFFINVPDMRVLKQIKNIGEAVFGRDADKKRFETLRLDQVQGLLLNFATASGQDPEFLPLYQRFFGKSKANQRFDPSRGVPALGDGGIVTSPTLAVVGEKGPEAIVPLRQMGNTFVFNISGVDSTSMRALLPTIKREVNHAVADGMKRDLGRRPMRDAIFGV